MSRILSIKKIKNNIGMKNNMPERRKSCREFHEKVLKLGYKSIDEFFEDNPLMSYKGMAHLTGVSYQTASKYHKKWVRQQLTLNKERE